MKFANTVYLQFTHDTYTHTQGNYEVVDVCINVW